MVSALGLCGPEMFPPIRRLDPADEAAIRERMRGLDPRAFAAEA